MYREKKRLPDEASESGIALMVVMVVFIILYLVVFQLHYTTKLEERLSKARTTDSLGSAANRSVALCVLGLLAEDYQKGGSGSASAAPGSPEARTGEGAGDGAGPVKGSEKKTSGRIQSSAGTDPSAQPVGAAGGPTWHDYLRENIFLQNQQSINGVTVKITMIDNERCFDLNRLWDYPPSQAETLSETNEERMEEAATDTGDPLLNDLMRKAGKSKKSKKSARDSTGTEKATGRRSSAGALAGAGDQEPVAGLEEAEEWEPPSEEKRVETTVMLQRAMDMMYRLNTEHGFEYQVQPPGAPALAEAIERYAHDRRSQPFQSYIHLPSELLNVLAMLGASPEVYYGPQPRIAPGEEFYDRNESFRYQRDEFGDLVGEYIYAEDRTLERELMEEQLSQLQSLQGYSQFTDFSSIMPELGRMGNPMTRNMQEFAEVEDDLGNVSLAVPPEPIGLRDLFTTFSTGKININTASVPVLYALLPLIIDSEPEGELRAQGIALNIEIYRNSFQPVYDESDPLSADRKASSAGAPHRQPPPEGTGQRGAGADLAAGLLGSSGAAAAAGLSAEELASAASGGSSDYETNYFTSLSQLKLIDGESGDRDDYLTEGDSATTTSTLEQKTPLQKAMHDYGQVMVFGSTHFTATLKSKAQDSGAIKTGYLTVIRDVPRKRLEVLQWKELQK